MDVLLNQEEEMIRDGLRRFFETECDTDRVRGIEDGETRIDGNLWQQLAELGWLGLALPAAYGGGEAMHEVEAEAHSIGLGGDEGLAYV